MHEQNVKGTAGLWLPFALPSSRSNRQRPPDTQFISAPPCPREEHQTNPSYKEQNTGIVLASGLTQLCPQVRHLLGRKPPGDTVTLPRSLARQKAALIPVWNFHPLKPTARTSSTKRNSRSRGSLSKGEGGRPEDQRRQKRAISQAGHG